MDETVEPQPRTALRPVLGRHVRRTLTATPSAVREARILVDALLDGVSSETRDDVALMVSEAVTNAVLHAYAQPGGTVDVFAVRVGEELIFTVHDDGCGLGAVSERSGLGLGLGLVRRLADASRVLSEPGRGVRVQCRLALSDTRV